MHGHELINRTERRYAEAIFCMGQIEELTGMSQQDIPCQWSDREEHNP